MKINNLFLNTINSLTFNNDTEHNTASIFENKNDNADYTADEIANIIYDQITGMTLSNKTTTEKLSLINENNIISVLNKYKKLSGNDLSKDIVSEWSIITTLDTSTVKKYLCEPLTKLAQKNGIKTEDYEQITDIDSLTEYINKLTKDINIVKNSKYSKSAIKNDKHRPFEIETLRLMSKKNKHKTKLLNIAQDNLGLQEVTKEEFSKLSDKEKKKTQWVVMEGIDTARINHSWCAYTVSYLCKKANIDIGGTKAQVIQFINWAKNPNTPVFYHKIEEENNINTRKQQISHQIKNMKEGDFIIWKSKVLNKIDGMNEEHIASHIGIIETIKNGVVTVIEGNANLTSEPYRVAKTDEEAVYGNQIKGQEAIELNFRDGLIRKQYSIEELARGGYSGYIDTQKIVK